MANPTKAGQPSVVMLIERLEGINPVYVTAERWADRWFPCIDREPFGKTDGYDSYEACVGAWELHNELEAERRAEVFGS